jgi:hypothetical protein
MLDLQAQSIQRYLYKTAPTIIIVNEADAGPWFRVFDAEIRHRYQEHDLTILTQQDWDIPWHLWHDLSACYWSPGWETQQLLKLAAALHVQDSAYLVLDTQNFLIRPWCPQDLVRNQTTPTRRGHNSMPHDIWQDLAESFDIDITHLDQNSMSLCTPFFFDTEQVRALIRSQNTLTEFTHWFKSASDRKSEFVMYRLWLERQGGLNKYHSTIPEIDDWANPYLRDSSTNFEQNFKDYIQQLGIHTSHAWTSVNHKAWGNMTDLEYHTLSNRLGQYGLVTRFEQYRNSYVDSTPNG